MIPSSEQFEEAKRCCIQLHSLGCHVSMNSIGSFTVQYPRILIEWDNRTYSFTDEDWDVVIKQLQQLVKTIQATTTIH